VRTDASAWSVLAFSPDGRWLAANNGNDVRVLDTTTWGVVTTIAGPHIRALSFDPTSARLVTGSTDGDAALWAIPSGELLRVLRRGDPVDSVSWSPDGAWIATASRDGEQQIWNATSGVLRNQGNYIHDKISSLEFDSTSKTLLAAGTNGSVVLSDAEIGIPIAELGAPRSSVSSAHFDPTSQQVVGAFWDGTARVWGGAPAFRHWTSPPVSDSCGFGAALVPDGRFVAVGCRNRPTRIYDTANSQLLAELPNVTHVDEGEFTTVFPAVTADGDRAAIIRGETVEVYAVRSHKLVQTIDHHAAVSTVAFAPTGHDLVSGDVLGGVLLTREGARPRALPSAAASIDALAILADDRVIVSDASKRLRVLDPGHDAVLASIEAPMRAMLLRPSSAGDRLLTVPAYTASEAAVLWDLRRYKLVAQLVGHVGQTRSARFERDDLEIVTAGGDGTARRWDGFTGAPLESYQDGSRFLMDATLSPDGSMVVAAGGDGLVRFWDTATKRLLWSFPAHSPHVIALHFEDNDLVTRGFGGDISRWMLPKPQTVIERCETGTGCVTVSR
jgi:WD40 repeat protein